MDHGQPPGQPSPAMDCPRVPAGSRFPHGPLRLRQSPPLHPPSSVGPSTDAQQRMGLCRKMASTLDWGRGFGGRGFGDFPRAGWLRRRGLAARRAGSAWEVRGVVLRGRMRMWGVSVQGECLGSVGIGAPRAWPASGSVVMIRILPMNMSVAARWRTRCAGRPMRRGCEAVCVRA